MSYHFFEERAVADIAFEAEGETLADLFESAALALASAMIGDITTLVPHRIRYLDMRDASLEMLLYHFLQELIYLKDAEGLLFSYYDFTVNRDDKGWRLSAKIAGDDIDPGRQELLADVKAVSLHRFRVDQRKECWRAEVILDV